MLAIVGDQLVYVEAGIPQQLGSEVQGQPLVAEIVRGLRGEEPRPAPPIIRNGGPDGARYRPRQLELPGVVEILVQHQIGRHVRPRADQPPLVLFICGVVVTLAVESDLHHHVIERPDSLRRLDVVRVGEVQHVLVGMRLLDGRRNLVDKGVNPVGDDRPRFRSVLGATARRNGADLAGVERLAVGAFAPSGPVVGINAVDVHVGMLVEEPAHVVYREPHNLGVGGAELIAVLTIVGVPILLPAPIHQGEILGMGRSVLVRGHQLGPIVAGHVAADRQDLVALLPQRLRRPFGQRRHGAEHPQRKVRVLPVADRTDLDGAPRRDTFPRLPRPQPPHPAVALQERVHGVLGTQVTFPAQHETVAVGPDREAMRHLQVVNGHAQPRHGCAATDVDHRARRRRRFRLDWQLLRRLPGSGRQLPEVRLKLPRGRSLRSGRTIAGDNRGSRRSVFQ